jgi:predicted N-acetyltransferase YhbS
VISLLADLRPPEPLSGTHRLEGFDCGVPLMNDWLRKRALFNETSGASRTFVITDATGSVVGYYALAAGAVAHGTATSAVRRNMPDPVPVLVLGRLAVDRRHQGARLGAALLQDAVIRAMKVAADAGVRALLVHALSDEASAFYRRYGFKPSSIQPMTLMMRLPPG